MTSLPLDRVYLGFWIDHSQGTVLGSTLTVSANTANIVIAVLSLLIGFAGSHLWDLTAFLIFVTSATDQAIEAYRHQQQTLLRNLASPGAIALIFSKMSWYWRGTSSRYFGRFVFIASLAILCTVSFLLAGILSSQVIENGSVNVLAQSATCGYPDWTRSQAANFSAYLSTAAAQSFQYSKMCANGSLSNPTCEVFVTKSIPFDTEYAPCPFQDLCLMPQNPAISMDTGLIDTADGFGINAKIGDRIKFRKRTTCAPLNVTGRSSISDFTPELAAKFRGNSPLPGEQFFQWYFGNSAGLNATLGMSTYLLNISAGYRVMSVAYYGPDPEFVPKIWSTSNIFDPIAELKRNDSDTVLLGMTSGMLAYASPVDDPFFSAHRKTYELTLSRGNVTVFLADDPATYLACTEQYQFCLSNGTCTTLGGMYSALNQALDIGMNARQNATLFHFASALGSGPTDMALMGVLGSAPLLAHDQEVQFENELPPNQWELEIKNWQASILSLIQKLTSDYAAGVSTTRQDFDHLNNFPLTADDKALCHSQKMKAPNGINNISVFGLSFIAAVCGAIILANLSVTNIAKWLSRNGKIDSLGVRQWDQGGILQVQRKAYEGVGMDGLWQGDFQEVPITQCRDEKFADLSSFIVRDQRQRQARATARPKRTRKAIPSSASSSTANLIDRSYTDESVSSMGSSISSATTIRMSSSDGDDGEGPPPKVPPKPYLDRRSSSWNRQLVDHDPDLNRTEYPPRRDLWWSMSDQYAKI